MTPTSSTNSSTRSPGAGSHPVLGYLAIAAATFCWAASAALGKGAFTGHLAAGSARLDPLILSQARTTISCLVLAPLLWLSRGRGALAMRWPDVARCLLLGVGGFAASNFFYYQAIQMTTVSTAIILQYVAPAWVLLYLVARRQQRATFLRVGAVTAAVVGCVLVVGVLHGARLKLAPAGIAVAELAALSFAFTNVYGHGLVQRLDRWKVIVYGLVGAALFWQVLNPPWKIVAAHYTGGQWLFLAGFAILSILLPYAFYFTGLKLLDATRAVVTSCLEPVFAISLAAIFLGERLDGGQVLGVAIVLASTIAIQLPERPAGAAAA